MSNFTELLDGIRRGVAAGYVDEQLAKLLREIESTGKGGAITVKLAFKPDKADENAAEITATCSVTYPKRDLPKGVVYIENGGATRSDPRQIEMKVDPEKKHPGVTGADLNANANVIEGSFTKEAATG